MLVVYKVKTIKGDIEMRVFLLEKRVALLKKENESISKILIEKVKPVCDEWENKKAEDIKEHMEALYG